MAFNVQAAKQAGYTDQEIQSYLQQQQQYKPNLLNNVLSTGGAIGGGLLGGAGGVIAGAAIPGADLTGVPEAALGYAGGVAGAGVGAGAGNASADFIRGLFGDKTVNPQQTLQNTPEQMAEGAAGQAIGLPMAKGMGIVAHPIANVMGGGVPFIKGVDATLGKSAKQIDIGDILGLYKKNVIPEMEKKGLGFDATQAFNKMSADMTGATSAYKASPDVMDTGGLGMNIPIKQANQLARNVQQSVKNFYGQSTQNADISARKAFAGLLKDAIHTAEPATKTADKIAHKLYQGPDIANGLLQILSMGRPEAARALQMVGNIPNAITNKVIPANGGYLKKALPSLIQTLLQTNQQQDQATQ